MSIFVSKTEFDIKTYGRNRIPTYFCNFLIQKINIFATSAREGTVRCFELGKPVAEFKYSEVGKPLSDFTVRF